MIIVYFEKKKSCYKSFSIKFGVDLMMLHDPKCGPDTNFENLCSK